MHPILRHGRRFVAHVPLFLLLCALPVSLAAGEPAGKGGCPPKAEDCPDIVPPDDALRRMPTPQELETYHERVRRRAAEKLQRARLLMRTGFWTDCIELCNDILRLDPANQEAREIRRQALEAREANARANIRVEQDVRSKAVLRQVSKEALVPHRGPDLRRPDIREEAMPFPFQPEERAAGRALLQQRLPAINLIDADLNYVLQLLFKTTGVNIIYNPKAVDGKTITIHARDLTLEDVLKHLRRTLGVGYTVDRQTVWIYSAEEGEAARALMTPVVIPLRTGLTRKSGETGVSDIEAMLEWMEENWPGWPEETTWTLDRKLNRLIVASTPDAIIEIRKMVTMLDVAPVQVMITTRFVAISENNLDQLGLNWNLQMDPTEQPSFGNDGFGVPTATANAGVPAQQVTAEAVGVLSDYQLSVTLRALSEATDTKVLSAPRVIALNNQTAMINLVEKYPYPTDWETITAGTSGTDTSSTATTVIPSSWAEQDLGIKLQVLPSVGSDMRTVTLDIMPEITQLTDTYEDKIVTTNSTGQQQAVDITRPIFATRTLEARAVVEDGQTVVVGGLFEDQFTDTHKEIPFLGKIPVLGRLFRSKNMNHERSCLLIFVTARIITPTNRVYTDEADAPATPAPEGQIPPAETLNRWLGDPQPAR